ncbi:MAG TPA: putative Ig domain-containing protein [Candidatus Acidoferrales bacterium]
MKNCARNICSLALLTFVVLQLSSCALTPDSFHSVVLTPKGTTFIGQNNTIGVTATVLNDLQNGGVVFSASPAGTGLLTQTTINNAIYVAPAIVTTETVVTITAVAVDYPKQSSTLTLKIEPPPVITTTTLQSATLNQAYSQPVTATGGVPPLSWAIASGSLPAGLSLAASTSDTVNIVGKPTTGGNSTFTISVTDATGASNTSVPLNIVVSTLQFTTTSPLPPAQVGTAYSDQLAATGGTGNLTFTVASGSNLPAGFNLSSAGLLTSASPAAAGTFTFGITVTDSGTPPAAITQTFTLVVSGQQNLALLNGSYAFSFSGNNTAGYIAAAGAFTTNGAGQITAGEATYNSLTGPPVTYTGITGTYTAGTDGRGTITFTSASPAFAVTPTYAFAIDPGGNGHGRLIEFDTTGGRGSGRIEKQIVTSCVVTNASTTYNGNFAFGGSGFSIASSTGAAGPIAFAGAFTAAAPVAGSTIGSIGPGEMDANTPGFVTSQTPATLSGTYQSASSTDTTYCTFSLGTSSIGNLTFNAYPVSNSEAFLVEMDQTSQTTPLISVADMVQQIGNPFPAQNSLAGPMAGGLNGSGLSGNTYLTDVAIVQLSSPGSGGFTMQVTDNVAGSISTWSSPFQVSYQTDTFGRVTTNLIHPFEPTLYLIDSQDAFVVGLLLGGPIAGRLDAQSQPQAGFTTQFLAQNTPLIEGTVAPAVPANRDVSGFLMFDGSVTPGGLSGTQDESTTAANVPGEAVTGTFALSSTGTTDGSGTVTLTSPAASTGAFYFINSTKAVIVTTTSGDSNPVLIVVGH